MLDGLVVYATVVLAGSKGLRKFGVRIKFKIAAAFSLALFAILSFFVAFALTYAVPSASMVKGRSIPVIPLVLGLIQLALAVACLRSPEGPAGHMDTTPKSYAPWIWYCVACSLWFASYYSFMLSIYSPNVYKASVPVPEQGMPPYLIGAVLSASALYAAARSSRDSAKRTLFVWIGYFAAFYCMFEGVTISLLLIYETGGHHHTVYPLLASLVILGDLPYALLTYSLIRIFGKRG
jgi:hypothetical protein